MRSVFSGYAQRVLLLQACFVRGLGAWLFEWLQTLGGPRHKSGQRLDAQAAIHIRSKQGPHPAHVFAATLHAIFSTPQRDNRYEPRFMVCDHDETSCETGYFSECSIDCRGQSGVDLVRFIGLSNKLDVECRDP